MIGQEKTKVLIVDDVEVNVKLLEAYLAKFDFIILKAYGGNEALKIAKDEHPNLILLDVMHFIIQILYPHKSSLFRRFNFQIINF